jgi:hypothetical protein
MIEPASQFVRQHSRHNFAEALPNDREATSTFPVLPQYFQYSVAGAFRCVPPTSG